MSGKGDKIEKLEKGEKLERGDRERTSRSRRESRFVIRAEGAASPNGAFTSTSRPNSGKEPNLVDVTPGKSFSRRCVILTVILAVLIALGVGAALFFLIYYLLVLMNYCPWTRLDTGCYQFFQDDRNWHGAQEVCKERGGRLAELAGFDKQTDVVNLFSNGGHSPSCFWVGGYESDSSTMLFTWNVSTTVMSQYFTEWESGYPKNRTSGSTCVDFCHPDFSWKNKNCDLLQNYLCEYG